MIENKEQSVMINAESFQEMSNSNDPFSSDDGEQMDGLKKLSVESLDIDILIKSEELQVKSPGRLQRLSLAMENEGKASWSYQRDRNSFPEYR